MFFSPYNPPSEEQVQQWQMQGESFTRSVISFLEDELSKDQLLTMYSVLSLVNKDERMNGYFQGIVTSALRRRFDVCPCRGLNSEHEHTTESHFELGEDTDAEQAKTEPMVDQYVNGDDLPPHQFPDDISAEEHVEAMRERAKILDDIIPPLPEEVIKSEDLKGYETLDELLDAYKLDTSDQPGDPRVRCRRCGMQYPSVADRTLRGITECSGCEQAEKSGSWLDRWA